MFPLEKVSNPISGKTIKERRQKITVSLWVRIPLFVVEVVKVKKGVHSDEHLLFIYRSFDNEQWSSKHLVT